MGAPARPRIPGRERTFVGVPECPRLPLDRGIEQAEGSRRKGVRAPTSTGRLLGPPQLGDLNGSTEPECRPTRGPDLSQSVQPILGGELLDEHVAVSIGPRQLRVSRYVWRNSPEAIAEGVGSRDG
jgi:hypothetical protein